MSSLSYIYKRTFVNKLKKALKRPVSYIAAVAIVGYAAMIIFGFGSMAREFNLKTPENLTTILAMTVFFIMPADIISYSKRKGLVFKLSDIHFIFPAPENPKRVLILASIKNYIVLAVTGILVSIFGIIYFSIAPWRMILYFVFFAILENVLEGSMIIICYGNQSLPKKFFKILPVVLYAFMAIFVIAAVVMLCTQGLQFDILSKYLALPVIQAIPVVGWAIAFIHLIIIGPTVVNVICTICYVVTVFALFLYARKMECTGEYYEDAMTFAQDYDIRMKKARKGQVVLSNKKKKYAKNVSVEYKGTYAQAIFYRQLLEYKKTRFFIFGWNTILSLGIGVTIAIVAHFTDLVKSAGASAVFIIPGIMAYIVFIFSGYATKWSKELENPYTYLIPDSGLRKLWYATKMEHIRSFIDGCLITIPAAIGLQISPIAAVLTILVYVCLIANKLYLNMLSDAILGKMLGNAGKSLLRTLFQGIAITFSILAAALCGGFIGVTAGFVGMILVTIIISMAAAVGASTSFDRMESFD
jgi:hypothetical protein